MMTANFDKLRTDMYGGSSERFHEIITLLTDPNLTKDEIPLSVCEADISFVCQYKRIEYKERTRSELLRLLLVDADAGLAENLLDYAEYYTTKCSRLIRFLNSPNITYVYNSDGSRSYKRTTNLIHLIGEFTEVTDNE